MEKEVKYCKRCIYNTGIIPALEFDESGICSYCQLHDQMDRDYPTGEEGWKILTEIAEKVKKNGEGKKYDCVVGVSGGTDSSYMVYLLKEKLGLRPLAVHFDNTWNSKIAVENIQKVLKKLDVDLYTYVIDNEEFCDMSRSFLEAAVSETDCITDIALTTTLYLAADKYDVKYIFDGHNFRTEGTVPLDWSYFDGKYISSIHKRFGKKKMKTFPNLWLRNWFVYLFKKIKRIRPLNYLNLDKDETKEFLSKEFDWQWYGGHHLENRHTKFHHYLSITRFKKDKRYVELSAFVRSGKMTREKALEEIKKPIEYPKDVVEEIKRRLGFTDEEYEEVLKRPIKSAKDYKTYHPTFKKLRPVFWAMYKAQLVPRTFYEKYTK